MTGNNTKNKKKRRRGKIQKWNCKNLTIPFKMEMLVSIEFHISSKTDRLQ